MNPRRFDAKLVLLGISTLLLAIGCSLGEVGQISTEYQPPKQPEGQPTERPTEMAQARMTIPVIPPTTGELRLRTSGRLQSCLG
jgi:hypothetical protein